MSLLPALVVAFAIVATPFAVRASGTETGADTNTDDVLRAGAEVYTLACSSCHQPGGAGLAGQFPPLLGNPNVDDTDYMETVIRNGLSGEIMVNDQTFDGLMPAQSTLSDQDIAAVVAYVQSGFASPAIEAPDVLPGADSDSGLPDGARWGVLIALVLAVMAIAYLYGAQVIAAHDPRELTWSVAWMKSAVIVVGVVLATTYVPTWALESGFAQDRSRTARDLITVGVWSAGLTAALFALWYAHRKRRI